MTQHERPCVVAINTHNADNSSSCVPCKNVRNVAAVHALTGRCVADRFGGSAISAGDLGSLPHRTAQPT